MSIPALSISILLAIAPLLWLPALPNLPLIWGAIAAAIPLAIQHHKGIRFVGFWLLFFSWGILAALEAVWPMQHLTAGPQQAEVLITSTDGSTMHQGKIIRLNGHKWPAATGVALYGNYLPQPACVGQRWKMSLHLRPVHGLLNEGGFDSQRNAFAAHQPLTGKFSHAEAVNTTCSVRATYLNSLSLTLSGYPWKSVILGLGMGERLVVDRETKKLMRETGTLHLMAISGLHIALAASLLWLVARGIQFLLPCGWIDWRIPLITGAIFAAFYAWLTGMQPPALRTVIALAVLALLRMSGRQWSPWQVWLCCVAAIVVVDPLAVLSHSLALSAFAVAALIFWYQWIPVPAKTLPWAVKPIINLLHLQLGMLCLLLPLQVAIFHGVSLSSLIANVFAVPLVTFISVPLILIGMLLHLLPLATAEMVIWSLADKSLQVLFWSLSKLPNGWLDVDERWLPLTLLPWLAIIGWRFQAWRSFTAASLAAAILLAYPFWRTVNNNNWTLHMLDVGQGLAMVVERNGHAVLYDTGLSWPGGDSASQVIIPWLRWHHLVPDDAIISHEHADHIGGLNSLREAWPAMWVRSPLRLASHLPCFRGQQWRWQGLNFTVHWPPRNYKGQGNNRSCVVKIDDGKQSVLLTGDIEAQAELSMLSHHWRYLRSTLIQVPHHGSNTSSTLALLQRTEGALALASAARYNAWRFPSAKVIKRYKKEGYLWIDTPQSGQISVAFSPDGRQIRRLREHNLPRWYHQWFGVPADNG